jgi:hypothetical protein
MKKNKQDLEQMHLNGLVLECQKVMDNSALDQPTQEKAEQLKSEWTALVSREAVGETDNRSIHAEQAKLKDRMVEFLAII